MSNEFLVSQIQQGIDTVDNLESLYRQNLGLIHSAAKRYSAYAETEDLVQEGFLALREAAEKYDPDRDVLFSTHLMCWLRKYMQLYIVNSGSTIRIPSHMHSFVVKYIKFARDYTAEHGSEPSEAEISHHLGVGIKQVKSIKENVAMGRMASLDACINDSDGSSQTYSDTVPDDVDLEESVIDAMWNESMKAELWSAVDALPDKQSQVVKCRFAQDMTLAAAGKALGITTEVVRQSQNSALRVLRRRESIKRLAEEAGIIDKYAWGGGVQGFKTSWTSSTERTVIQLIESERRSAIRAGYSPDTANEQGSQNLAKLSIRTRIDKAIM